jgi:hypothetical protein
VAIDSRSWSSGLRALALDAAAGSNLIAKAALNGAYFSYLSGFAPIVGGCGNFNLDAH